MFNLATMSSTIHWCCKVVQLFILLDSFLFMLVSSAKFCYVGMNANSKEALRIQSCLTNKTHMAESLLATEYRPDVHYDLKSQNNTSLNSNKSPLQDCYIFRHILRETLPNDVKKESVHTRFSCDFEDVCKGKQKNKIVENVVLNREDGELYCCEEDNCNAIDKMPKTPVENRICYNGISNASNVALESCGHPDTYCITRTLFENDKQVEIYSCDNNKACDFTDQHGAYQFCHDFQNANITEKLCCCVANQCNRPFDPSVILKVEGLQANAMSTDSGRQIFDPISNPNSTSNDTSTTLVKGLVASIVMVALVGIVVLLVLAYRKRKCRDGTVRTDPNVIMQYERLSCSDASLEGSVSV